MVGTKFKAIGLVVLLAIAGVVHAQEKIDSPKPKFSEMTDAEKKAYLHTKYGITDSIKLDTPVSSMREAATTGVMPYAIAGFAASTAYDVYWSRHCAEQHNCSEGNPLYRGSAVKAGVVGAATTVAVSLAAIWLRKHQHGSTALILLSIPATLHLTFGIQAERSSK